MKVETGIVISSSGVNNNFKLVFNSNLFEEFHFVSPAKAMGTEINTMNVSLTNLA